MKTNFIFKKRISFPKDFRLNLEEVILEISEIEFSKFGNINIVFCSDKFIKEYNRDYLKHDYETDIITFQDTDENGKIEGELLISVDTVKYNAIRYRTEILDEFARVVFHGILHLCGYKDKSKTQKGKMKKKEDYYLKKFKSLVK